MNKTLTLLLVIGILVSSASLLISHYYAMPDLMYGTIVGIGLGLMLLSFSVKLKKMRAER